MRESMRTRALSEFQILGVAEVQLFGMTIHSRKIQSSLFSKEFDIEVTLRIQHS